MKTCSMCGYAKPLTEFNKKRDGLQPKCKTCCAIQQRAIRYGITEEQYQQLLAKQDGVCAICERPDRTYDHLSVDHDHETGAVRGLLCGHCNHAIGKMGDDPELLRKAALYLERHN